MKFLSEEEKDDYPNLKKEIADETTPMVPLQYVCESKAESIEQDLEKEAEMKKKIESMPDPYRFSGYDPNVIDFIRRCDTEEQAIEIIEFLMKKGDINSDTADALTKQLKTKGLRSFGEKKQDGFYFHHDD